MTNDDDKKNTLLKGKLNYPAWKIRTRATARSQGLLGTLDGIDTQPTTGVNSKGWKAWKARRDSTYEMLVKKMDDNQLHHASGYEEDPAGLWSHLTTIHEGSGLGGLMEAWRNFHNIRYTNWDDDIADTTGQIRSLANHLTTAYQDEPSPNQTIARMMSALPSEFSSLITLLDNTATPLTVDIVEQRIISAWPEAKRDAERNGHLNITRSRIPPNETTAALYSNTARQAYGPDGVSGLTATGLPHVGDSYSVTCTNPICGRRGHTIDQCFWEGGGKAGEYPEWYIALRKNRGQTIPPRPTAHFASTTIDGVIRPGRHYAL